MSFLTPLYIAGLLAVSLPLVFHLIRRTPRGRTSFGSLMFLSASPPRLTRKSRLDHLLLLLLRAAAICLLALAFSRPFFRGAAALERAAVEGRRTAILMDASASMRREDLWRQAETAVEETLDEMDRTDPVALLTFDDKLQTLVGFEESRQSGPARRRALLLSRMGGASPSWGATDLGGALAATAELLEAENDRARSSAGLQIVLVSDLQEGARLEALQAIEWPQAVRVEVKPVRCEQTTNAALAVLADEPGRAPEAGGRRVRVASASDSRRDRFEIRWSGPPGAPSGPAPLRVYVPPGQSRVIVVPDPPPGSLFDRLTLSGDDHEFDNTFYVAPRRRTAIGVEYAGNDAADDPHGLRYYLERAFADANRPKVRIAALPAETSSAPPRADSPSLAVIGRAPSPDELAALQRRMLGGATIFCVLSDVDSGPVLAALLELPNISLAEAEPADYALLGEIDFHHPLFAPFADPRFNDFTKIHFWRYRRIELDPGAAVRVIARFDSGDPAVLERDVGEGKVVVMASSWRPEDSDLARSSKFVPFLAGLLQQSRGGSVSSPYCAVHEPLRLRAEDRSSTDRTWWKPDGSEVKAAPESTVFEETDEPGLYRMVLAGRERSFAVNVSATESGTAPLEADLLEQFGVRLGQASPSAESLQRRRQVRDAELENRQKVWRWLLVATLIVLLGETWLAGRLARPIATATLAGR